MKTVPTSLQYSNTQEWVRQEDDIFTIGITDYAQTMLGDLVYVELPEPESHIERGEECALIESTKAAADVWADDAHFAFRNAREQGYDRAHHMGRLRCHERGELAAHRIETGNAATGLERAGVNAWIKDMFFDRYRCGGKSGFGCFIVAGIPSEDVVMVLARAMCAGRFTGEVFA